MRPPTVQRTRLNLVAMLLWLTVVILLVLTLGLGEMRQARQQLNTDIAQLNADAKTLLLRPLLLDPDYPKRLAFLGEVMQKLQARLDHEPRLIGLDAQRQRMRGLSPDVGALERELSAMAQLTALLQRMTDMTSTDLQISRMEQNLRTSVAPVNDLVRLHAFLVARKASLEAGAVPDPFLTGVDKPAQALGASLAAIDRFEARRTDLLTRLDDAQRGSVLDVEGRPMPAPLTLGLAALAGVLLLGFPALVRGKSMAPPVQDERHRHIGPMADTSSMAIFGQPMPAEFLPGEINWRPKFFTEPTLGLALQPPVAAAPTELPVLFLDTIPKENTPPVPDEAWLDLLRSVDSAVEANLGLERRVRGLVVGSGTDAGSPSQSREMVEQVGQSVNEAKALLQRARESAINMAMGGEAGVTAEDRFYSAQRLEQNLSASLLCLDRLQAWSTENAPIGDRQFRLAHRSLVAFQFELEHQLARQQADLRSLSRSIQQVQAAQAHVR